MSDGKQEGDGKQDSDGYQDSDCKRYHDRKRESGAVPCLCSHQHHHHHSHHHHHHNSNSSCGDGSSTNGGEAITTARDSSPYNDGDDEGDGDGIDGEHRPKCSQTDKRRSCCCGTKQKQSTAVASNGVLTGGETAGATKYCTSCKCKTSGKCDTSGCKCRHSSSSTKCKCSGKCRCSTSGRCKCLRQESRGSKERLNYSERQRSKKGDSIGSNSSRRSSAGSSGYYRRRSNCSCTKCTAAAAAADSNSGCCRHKCTCKDKQSSYHGGAVGNGGIVIDNGGSSRITDKISGKPASDDNFSANVDNSNYSSHKVSHTTNENTGDVPLATTSGDVWQRRASPSASTSTSSPDAKPSPVSNGKTRETCNTGSKVCTKVDASRDEYIDPQYAFDIQNKMKVVCSTENTNQEHYSKRSDCTKEKNRNISDSKVFPDDSLYFQAESSATVNSVTADVTSIARESVPRSVAPTDSIASVVADKNTTDSFSDVDVTCVNIASDVTRSNFSETVTTNASPADAVVTLPDNSCRNLDANPVDAVATLPDTSCRNLDENDTTESTSRAHADSPIASKDFCLNIVENVSYDLVDSAPPFNSPTYITNHGCLKTYASNFSPLPSSGLDSSPDRSQGMCWENGPISSPVWHVHQKHYLPRSTGKFDVGYGAYVGHSCDVTRSSNARVASTTLCERLDEDFVSTTPLLSDSSEHAQTISCGNRLFNNTLSVYSKECKVERESVKFFAKEPRDHETHTNKRDEVQKVLISELCVPSQEHNYTETLQKSFQSTDVERSTDIGVEDCLIANTPLLSSSNTPMLLPSTSDTTEESLQRFTAETTIYQDTVTHKSPLLPTHTSLVTPSRCSGESYFNFDEHHRLLYDGLSSTQSVDFLKLYLKSVFDRSNLSDLDLANNILDTYLQTQPPSIRKVKDAELIPEIMSKKASVVMQTKLQGAHLACDTITKTGKCERKKIFSDAMENYGEPEFQACLLVSQMEDGQAVHTVKTSSQGACSHPAAGVGTLRNVTGWWKKRKQRQQTLSELQQQSQLHTHTAAVSDACVSVFSTAALSNSSVAASGSSAAACDSTAAVSNSRVVVSCSSSEGASTSISAQTNSSVATPPSSASRSVTTNFRHSFSRFLRHPNSRSNSANSSSNTDGHSGRSNCNSSRNSYKSN